MNSVLKENLDKFCTVYLDNILIYSKNEQEHEQHLCWVPTQLRAARLKAKRKKCSSGLPEVEYLGHIVSKDGLKADPAKCKAIADHSPPMSVRELQMFLGTVNYYSKFVPNYAKICAPLYALLRKDTPWKWSDEHEMAFRTLQNKLTQPPVLCLPDFTKPFQLETDSSDFAIGAVLAQQQSDASMRPIAYYSKALISA